MTTPLRKQSQPQKAGFFVAKNMGKAWKKLIVQPNSTEFEDVLRGHKLKFKVAPGVFSPQRIDDGSRLLIDNLKIQDGTMIADVGCGNGVIGFVAAKLNSKGYIHLLDVNLRAINLAKENVFLNHLDNVEVYLSDLFSGVPDRSYHLILSNPAQHQGNAFLEESVKESLRHLKNSGKLIWVVQKHVRPYIERLFNKHFGNSTVLAYGREHVVIRTTKSG